MPGHHGQEFTCLPTAVFTCGEVFVCRQRTAVCVVEGFGGRVGSRALPLLRWWGHRLRNGTGGSSDLRVSNSARRCQQFSKVRALLHARRTPSRTPHCTGARAWALVVPIIWHSGGHCGFQFAFPATDDVEHIFHTFLRRFVSAFSSLGPFKMTGGPCPGVCSRLTVGRVRRRTHRARS